MNRRQYLSSLATGATAATVGLAGCSSLRGGSGGTGGSSGGGPNTRLPPPEMQADPEDLAYPAYGQQIPEVTLPAALAGHEVTTTDIDTPLALTFIYTTCQTACPVLTLALKRAKSAAREDGYVDDVTFAEITFDPARDDVAAFREYAQQRSIDLDTGNWYFLRPETEGRAKEVVHEQFGVAYEKTTPEEMDMYMFVHFSLVLLVNADGYVERTYIRGQNAVEDLQRDLERLHGA